MADLTVEEIETQIAALEAAKLSRLTSGVRTKVSYASGSVEKQVVSIEEINGEIARLQALLARKTGRPSGLGPTRIRFGGRL